VTAAGSGEAVAMWHSCRVMVLLRVVLLTAVTLSVVVSGEERLVDVQTLNVGGLRQRQLVSGTARRQAYRTTYTRETAAHGVNELVPEVININIEKEEHTGTCIRYYI